MKKNKMMRLASGLLVATLLTTSMISGTFAKYITEAEGTDEARVAKWGVDVNVEVGGAFATEYDADTDVTDALGQAIAKTVVSSNDDKLVAPGTGGDLLKTATISGEPEVAVNVKKEATLTLEGWEVDLTDDQTDSPTYYCPLKIVVTKEDGSKVTFNGMDAAYSSADDFIAAVEGALESDVNYEPKTDLTASQSVTWEWAYTGGVEQTDEADTALGDLAADDNAPTIALTYKITVTQIN